MCLIRNKNWLWTWIRGLNNLEFVKPYQKPSNFYCIAFSKNHQHLDRQHLHHQQCDVIIRWYFMNWFYNFKLKCWEKLEMWNHFMKNWFYDSMLKCPEKKDMSMLTFWHKVQKSVILIFYLEFYQIVPLLRNFCAYILTKSPKLIVNSLTWLWIDFMILS